MSFLYSLTIKKKLILSYLSLVIVSIVLSWNSISNCLTNKDVAGFVHTTLSERYGRTRATADYAFAVNTIIQSINNGASYDSAKELAEDLVDVNEDIKQTNTQITVLSNMVSEFKV